MKPTATRLIYWLTAWTLCTVVAPHAIAQQSKSAPASDPPTTSLGEDLSDPAFWTSVDGKPVQQSWEFADGEIRLLNPRGGSGSLLSPNISSDFELTFRWKIEKGTNSGLKYRVRKYGRKWLGVEYQILDGPLNDNTKGSTASIYDLVGTSEDKNVLPAGQWNRSRIVAAGHRLEHYLNGRLVSKTFTSGPAWDWSFANSKFWGNEGFAQPDGESRLMLTDHGGKAIYRDFVLTPIHVQAEGPLPQSTAPFLGNGIRNSWADQHSIVLWTRTTARPEMLQEGPQFKEGTQKQLTAASDVAELHAAQLPEGTTLDEMFGACPGRAGLVRLTYFPVLNRKAAISTEWAVTKAESDFTAQWQLSDLKPGCEYAAVIEAKADRDAQVTSVIRGGFRTAPLPSEPSNVRFCVTTCHDFLRRDNGMQGHKIYPAMTRLDPDFVVHAGDIEYYDKPEPYACTIDLMRFKWARLFSLPDNRQFYSRKTTYFMKDDHDTLKNDCWAGQVYGAVSFEEGVRLFNEEQFPSHTPRYKTVLWGRDLQVWLLEGRDFRSPNDLADGPEKTILGAEQKAWLKKTLAESEAAFKLVFTPTPIVGPDRDKKRDNHANTVFAHEGAELRAELAKHDGVVVLCGDRHWQYASVDDQTGLWEFGCGPGSEEHQLGWKKGDQRPVHRFLRVAGGFIAGEVSQAKGDQAAPKLTLRHMTVDGDPVSEFNFPLQDDLPQRDDL